MIRLWFEACSEYMRSYQINYVSRNYFIEALVWTSISCHSKNNWLVNALMPKNMVMAITPINRPYSMAVAADWSTNGLRTKSNIKRNPLSGSDFSPIHSGLTKD